MKYYAVKRGHQIGIFTDWKECEQAIKGFSSPEYKWFLSEEEAIAYLNDVDIYLERVKKDIENGYLVAYTDGSFDKQSNQYSYGVIIIDFDLIEHEASGSSRSEHFVETGNIAGEVFAFINALDWAVSNGYQKIKIYHDYEGLSKWIRGEWKANSTIANFLLSKFNGKFKDVIEVEFEHVKGHSNNRFNTKADQLASNAISSRVRIPITGNNFYTIRHVENSEFEELLNLIVTEEKEVFFNRIQESNRIIYKLGFRQDIITITNYLSGEKTLLVQGRVTLLFQIVLSYVQELLDNGTFKNLLSDAYRKTIDSVYVDEMISSIFGGFPHSYPSSIIKLIRQSVINLKYFVDSEEYSQYAYPALRALEGHIKYLLNKGGIIVTTVKGFDCFNKNPGALKHHLTNLGTLSSQQILAVEKLYHYYYINRHTLFHFGDITIDTTRLITEKNDVDDIINECLQMINDTMNI